MEKKPPKRMNRRTFWTWAIPIVVAHAVITLLVPNGLNGPWSAIDTALLIFLATALARRFRDIGWPAWTGATFLIATLLVIPMGVVVYALASHSTTSQVEQWITMFGIVVLPLNLLLIVIAGCVRGQPDIDTEIRAEFT